MTFNRGVKKWVRVSSNNLLNFVGYCDLASFKKVQADNEK